MAEVRITLLGGFAAEVGGEAVSDRAFRLRKARELVKLLALAPGHRLHREQAIDVLWRELSPAAGANNLNQAVHAARRVLGAEAVEVRNELLLLHADTDVEAFRAAVSEGRVADALELYCGELLPENRYDDWAEAPREELRELYEQLAARPPEDRVQRLPADTSSFVGRAHELAELRTLLSRTRLLTLTGTGGAGKTRLAFELARTTEDAYGDGVAIAELAHVSEPRLVAPAVAAALDVRALPGQPLEDALCSFLSPRELLLVLDNCEHVLGAAAKLVDTLLRSLDGLTVLATSREPLRVPGEVVFRVPSLAIPAAEESLSPDELLRFEAVRLFVDRATAASPGFALEPGNATHIARICVRLDGLPLALELAAGRVGVLGAAVVAERLDDRFRVLRAGSHAAPTRQQTLQATLQWSHDLLEEDERLLFRRLAVFAGGFELSGVEAVCAGDGLEQKEVVDVLARLLEKSLVTPETAAATPRYRLLETVRIYAGDRLAESGEAERLADRHADWAMVLAERERELPELDREAGNLRVALDTLLARRPTEALRLAVALKNFWLRRIDLAEANGRFRETLAAAPERTSLRAEALLCASSLEARGAGVRTGLALALESLEVAGEVGDALDEWRALQFLGEFSIMYEIEGADWLDRALAIARREGFAAAEALGIYTLGIARWYLGDVDAARSQVAKGIDAFRGVAGSGELVPAPMNIGEMRVATTAPRPGFSFVLEETLQPFVELPCDAALAYALLNGASIARVQGDFAAAASMLDESDAVFEVRAEARGRADALVRRGFLHFAQGRLPEARRCLEAALESRRASNDRRGIGLALSGLALIDTEEAGFDAAEARLVEARDLFRRAGDRWGLMSSLFRTADLELARSRPDAAEAAIAEAQAVLREVKIRRWSAHTVSAFGEVAVLRGDRDRGVELFEQARDEFRAIADSTNVAWMEQRLAEAAKPLQTRRKEAVGTTPSQVKTTRRKR